MKKILFVLLLSISSVVHAKWVFVDLVPELGAVVYIDKSSITQVSQFTRVWEKVEYTKISEMAKMNILSTRSYLEFDCREKKYRMLSFQSFRNNNLENFANGDDKKSEWKFIAPQTAYISVLEHICKKIN